MYQQLEERKQILRGLGTGIQSHPSVSMVIPRKLSRQTDVCSSNISSLHILKHILIWTLDEPL